MNQAMRLAGLNFARLACWSWLGAVGLALTANGAAPMELKLTSSAFAEGALIPKDYTCDGKDVSPPLSWSGAPPNTRALALIVDDPDAPAGTWVHWVLFNIPSGMRELPQAVPPHKVLADGTRQGKNDFGKIGYGGPCPPSGIHRYFFKLYALEQEVKLEPGATKPALTKAMEGHILANAQLMGRYKR